jgi:hypothetical protein
VKEYVTVSTVELFKIIYLMVLQLGVQAPSNKLPTVLESFPVLTKVVWTRPDQLVIMNDRAFVARYACQLTTIANVWYLHKGTTILNKGLEQAQELCFCMWSTLPTTGNVLILEKCTWAKHVKVRVQKLQRLLGGTYSVKDTSNAVIHHVSTKK